MKKSLQILLSTILVIVASFSLAISPVNAQVLIDGSQKSGELIVPATQETNLPYLTNTSNSPITLKIQAEGKWSFGPGEVYGKLVDANGNPEFPGAPNDMQFPSYNAATLVALKNNKPVAGGKEQTIELLPGETVSFINNDVPTRYFDNSGSQTIKFSIVSPPVSSCNGSNSTPKFELNIPYKSFANDSPFKSLRTDSEWFYLEDFKDANFAVNTPGASSSIPNVGANSKSPEYWDTVDEDDGKIDGKGSGKDRFLVFKGDNVRFIFDKSLGDFPTDAGIVWTDVHTSNANYSTGNLTFEAFDASGKSLGAKGPFVVGGDNSTMGKTDEDRFFGVRYNGGISAIQITIPNVVQGMEFDHLQYGRKCRN